MKVIFFGTPLFSAHVLEYLLHNGVKIAAVVSKPDRPKGRSAHPVPTPVKTVALSQTPPIPLFQPHLASDPDFAEFLRPFDADLFVVVAYGEIIKQHLLEMPQKGCINLHVSLLPKYRGAAPIQRCIIEGEKETGATVIHMVKKMDAGDVINSVKVSIGEDMTFGELEEALCTAGKSLLLDAIHAFERGDPPCIPQNPAEATFASKIELEDCEIHWRLPSLKLHNLVRGVNPFPGAWCTLLLKGEKKRLKIWRTKIVPCEKMAPGIRVNPSQKGNIQISTGEGALELLEVQLEGKKSMSSEELLRGIPSSHFTFIT